MCVGFFDGNSAALDVSRCERMMHDDVLFSVPVQVCHQSLLLFVRYDVSPGCDWPANRLGHGTQTFTLNPRTDFSFS